MRISDWSSDVCSSDLGTDRSWAVRRIRPWHAPLAPPRPAAPSSPIHPSVAGGPPPGPPTLRLAPQETSADARSAAPPASDVRDLDQGHLFGHVRSEEHTSELQSLMRS